jgi:hypothetical protein
MNAQTTYGHPASFQQQYTSTDDGFAYCQPCTKRLRIVGTVETVTPGIGEPVNTCAECRSDCRIQPRRRFGGWNR